jgi:hypothetical protein
LLEKLAKPEAAWNAYANLRIVARPAASIMLEGSDSRLDLDVERGTNQYGCSPLPQMGGIELSSSTATTVSFEGLSAAEKLRRKLISAAALGRTREVLLQAAIETKAAVLETLGFSESDAVPILAASGTTGVLFATLYYLSGMRGAATAILVGAEESGSGISLAAAGCHPASRTPTTGAVVNVGDRLGGFEVDLLIQAVPVRNKSNEPVPVVRIVDQIERLLEQALTAGKKVLLHVMECSKTGLVAPGFEAVQVLRHRYPQLPIIVDACQLRTDFDVLRRYVKIGCAVVVTGSKFYGGPAFSAALILPASQANHRTPLPNGLADYSWRGDWPHEWGAMCVDLPQTTNPGLLMRWQAALEEIKLFHKIPKAIVTELLRVFGQSVRTCLADLPEVRLLDSNVAPEITTIEPPPIFSSLFTFGIAKSVGVGWLGVDELRRIYTLLRCDLTEHLPSDALEGECRVSRTLCHIGQPVVFPAGSYPAGLRLSAGSRLLTLASHNGHDWLYEQVSIMTAKLRFIIRRLPHVYTAQGK